MKRVYMASNLATAHMVVAVLKENDIVAVVRWIDRKKTQEFVELLLGAQNPVETTNE